jgi:molybdopterin biosynthesis enzyme
MSLDDALQALLAHITPLSAVESVATLDADGRILAQDLVSALQVPAFDNSSMDGYAVRSSDVQKAAHWRSTWTALPAFNLLHSTLRSFNLGRSRQDTPMEGSRLWLWAEKSQYARATRCR